MTKFMMLIFICFPLTQLGYIQKKGFDLINVTPLKTHGGSMRYTLARNGKFKISDIVNKILKKEKDKNYTRFNHASNLKKIVFCLEQNLKTKLLN